MTSPPDSPSSRDNDDEAIDAQLARHHPRNLAAAENTPDLTAIGASLDDFKKGERSRPPEAFLTEFARGTA